MSSIMMSWLLLGQTMPGIYLDTGVEGSGSGTWFKVWTGTQWINEKPLAGTGWVEPKVADTAILWVDRNHAAAVASKVSITGDGMHIVAGWWLNKKRVSAYRTLGNNVPIWVDSIPDAAWDVMVEASSANRFVASSNGHPTMDCYDKGSAAPLWEFAYPTGFSCSGWKASAVSYDGTVAAFIGSNGVVGKVWVLSVATGDTLWTRQFTPGNGVYGVDLSSDGSVCLVTTYDSCFVWDQGVFRGKFGHYGQVPSAISGDGSIVASANYNATVQVYQWNGSSYVLLWQNNVANSWATAVDVSRDGSTIACGTGYANGTVRVYDVSSSTPLWTYAGFGGYGSGVWGVAVSGDGGHIISASWGDTLASDTFKVIAVHDRSSATPLLTVNGQFEPGSLMDCDISDDGIYATAGGKAVHAYTMGNGGEVYAIIIGSSPAVNVGTEAILSPGQWVQVGTPYNVRARFRNYGNAAASFPVYFRIDTTGVPVYNSNGNINNLAAGDTQSLTFSPQWTPGAYGLYMAYAWTALPGDGYPGDDTVALAIKCFHDAMALTIDQPFSEATINQSFTPAVTIKNNGSYTESMTVIFNIYDFNKALVYCDTLNSGVLAPDGKQRVVFPAWAPPLIGAYTAEAVAHSTDDFYPDDDTISMPFTVTYEIIYDDGLANAYYVVAFSDDNNKFAVRFTPTISPSIFVPGGRIYVNGTQAFEYVILCPDAAGRPDTAAPYDTVFGVAASSAPDWANFTFPSPIELTTGADVWLVVHWTTANPGAPGIGADNTWPVDSRSWWYNNTNGWTAWTAHDWMIRIMQAPGATWVDETGNSLVFRVGNPYPNPCDRNAVLPLCLPAETRVSVKLYTVDGRLAQTLLDGKMDAGTYSLPLALTVNPGVYFLRLVAGENRAVRKMVILR